MFTPINESAQMYDYLTDTWSLAPMENDYPNPPTGVQYFSTLIHLGGTSYLSMDPVSGEGLFYVKNGKIIKFGRMPETTEFSGKIIIDLHTGFVCVHVNMNC